MNMRLVRIAALCAAPVAGTVAAEDLPFADGKWSLGPSGVKVERVESGDVLAFETGIAYRRDVRLQDGTIEFDVQLTRRRSFVYVMFRMAGDADYEEFYLRAHKSGLPDAVQYAPVYQGHSAWQLRHGPGATAAVEFEPGAWTHVRVVLQGPRAALFVGNGAAPVLVVPRLAREPRSGYVALRAFLPPGSLGSGPAARYRNVRVQPGEAAFDFASAAVQPDAPAPGAVRAWSVSQAFVPSKEPPSTLPGADVLGAFQRLETEPSGLLELHRYITLARGSRAAAAVARLRVRSAAAGVRAFDLGFSDRATVFLNGRPLFGGEASYSFDNPRREGLIEPGQARVWLPLSAGENELAVLVSDSFGGWGLVGRFPDMAGIDLDPH